jgi:hypothetical protein
MLRLKLPIFSFNDSFEQCRLGITGNSELLDKMDKEGNLLNGLANSYIKAATEGRLYSLVALSSKPGSDPIVIGSFTKGDLLKLYSLYFSNKNKPGRALYDALFTAANEKCPFCGGIGRPRNLDHFLPQAYYPQFSILPINLVPSCRDCNMDNKIDNYATTESEQIIHPYIDNDRFFNDQWIYARYKVDNEDEPGYIEYFVQTPDYWDCSLKERAFKHFKDFDLGLRFSKEASARIITYLAQIHNLLQISLSLDDAKKTILEPAINSSPFVNHWERVMCLALMKDLTDL